MPYLSWRGESGKGVLRKALVPGVVGLLGVGVFFAAGVRGAGDLLILAFAVAGFVANAETAILFVRRKAVKTMGGYLAHIGMSIMLVGILISGVYEKRTTVNLVRNQPVSVGSNTLTFTRTVFVTDSGDVKRFEELNALDLSDRRAKQAMEVEVSSRGGSVWKAYPKLYTNTRTNQMMANPDVKSSPLMDLYVSPQAYDPGRSARIEGTTFALKKGESKTVEGVKVKFLDFSADRSQVSSARPHVTVTGNFLVTTAEASEEKTARLVMYFGGAATESATESPETPLPGKGRLKLLKRVAERRHVRDRASRRRAGRRPQARDGRDLVRRPHDEAAHLPRVGRLLRDDGGRPRGPRAPGPRFAPGGDRIAEPRGRRIPSRSP